MAKPNLQNQSALTQAQLKALVRYDPETGEFHNIAHYHKRGGTRGFVDARGYLATIIKGKKYALHRLAFLYMTGEWPKEHVDHRDGNTANNRWANLREATHAQNHQNRRARGSKGESGHIGVSRRPSGKWWARIGVGGKRVVLGTFPTIEAAAKAYRDAKASLHTFNPELTR